MFSFTNLATGNEIGANSYYLRLGDHGVVLDAGMHPKKEGRAALPRFERIDGQPVDALFLTHAHHDHVGALPVFMLRQPHARIFMTEPTYFLADPLLHNSVNVMKKQRLEANIPEYPLYTHQDIDLFARKWQACHLEERWSIEGFPSDDQAEVAFTFYHAGHILGSAGVLIEAGGKRVFYTGDVNFRSQTLMTEAEFPEKDIDVLIIETTRGAKSTPAGYSRQSMAEQFVQAIRETFERGGGVMVPIFAMGKTQEILVLLHEAQRRGELPDDPLFIGGLGKVFTQVYDRLAEDSVRTRRSLQMLEDIRPQILDRKKLGQFRPKPGHLLLLPSGMMTRNTSSNMLAHHFLSRPECGIFFVGYADPDSPGGHLLATPQGGEVTLDPVEGPVPVRCRIGHFDFTSHALREDLLDYIRRVRPKTCLLVHGDEGALAWFQRELREKEPKIQTIIPLPGEEIPL